MASEACRLGGISTGGWIVLSALAGMLVGTAATLLGQAVRRARQLKYLAAEPAPLLTHACRASAAGVPGSTVGGSLAPPHHLVATTGGGAPASMLPGKQHPPHAPGVYFSPLSAKGLAACNSGGSCGGGSAGGLQMQPLSAAAPHGAGRSSLQLRHSCEALGADAGQHDLAAAHDQQLARHADAHGSAQVLLVPQGQQPGYMAPAAAHAQHPPPLYPPTNGAATAHAAHMPAPYPPHAHQGPQARAPPNPYAAQQPTQQLLSPASEQLSSPESSYQIPGPAPPAAAAAVPHQQQQGGAGAAAAAAAAVAAAAAAAAAVHHQGLADLAGAASDDDERAPSAAGAAAHAAPRAGSSMGGSVLGRASVNAAAAATHELEDEYEIEDLDEDWIKLLGDVDARLAARGCPPLAPRERPVAIAQLLSATSSRGVDTAMAGALEAVLRFRAARGGR